MSHTGVRAPTLDITCREISGKRRRNIPVKKSHNVFVFIHICFIQISHVSSTDRRSRINIYFNINYTIFFIYKSTCNKITRIISIISINIII